MKNFSKTENIATKMSNEIIDTSMHTDLLNWPNSPQEWFIVDGWNTYGDIMVSGDLQSVFVPVVTPSAQTMWSK